jgi:hypothetical protein
MGKESDVEYRSALERPRLSDRNDRFQFPQDEGKAAVREAIGLLSVTAGLAVVIGIGVGLPVAMMLNDICASLNC